MGKLPPSLHYSLTFLCLSLLLAILPTSLLPPLPPTTGPAYSIIQSLFIWTDTGHYSLFQHLLWTGTLPSQKCMLLTIPNPEKLKISPHWQQFLSLLPGLNLHIMLNASTFISSLTAAGWLCGCVVVSGDARGSRFDHPRGHYAQHAAAVNYCFQTTLVLQTFTELDSIKPAFLRHACRLQSTITTMAWHFMLVCVWNVCP